MVSEAIEPAPVVVHASVAVEMAVGTRTDVPTAWRRWLAEDRILLAPAVHWTEVGDALLQHVGRDAAEAARRVEALEASGTQVEDLGAPGVRMALALAARHRLPVHDATYLWLAIDVDGELATLDRALAAAARAEGVALAIEP